MISLDLVSPFGLVDARLQLHHAVQIPASFGYAFVKPEPDWSHTSLTWSAQHRALVSSPLNDIRVGLRLADGTLVLISGGKIVASCSLDGKSLESGYQWMADALADADLGVFDKPLIRPDHELPDHPVAEGASFSLAQINAFETLAEWFEFADERLHVVETHHSHTSPVLCWPHHFDVARLVLLSRDADPSKDHSVGVGLSPGDGSYAEPYWYVTHWPSRENAKRPPLPSCGFWRTDGWAGAVLLASSIAHLDAANLADDFLSAAIDASLANIR